MMMQSKKYDYTDGIDDDEVDDVVAAAWAAFYSCRHNRRTNPAWHHLNWSVHEKKLERESQFHMIHQTNYRSFKKLLHILKPGLQLNAKQDSCQGYGICFPTADASLSAMVFSWWISSSYLNCSWWCQVYLFVSVNRGIKAIPKCPHLKRQFPTDEAGLKEVTLEIQNKSSFWVLEGCVGALDGWLCQINVPLGRDTSNISACFSGHYQCYGINVQAVCDSRCRFTYKSCCSPGGTGDSRAFYWSALSNFLQDIPHCFYNVADSTYTLSSSLLVPYTGSDKKRKENDVFHFYLPQLRIKIEQAFGLLVNKWRIFKNQLTATWHGFCLSLNAIFAYTTSALMKEKKSGLSLRFPMN